MGTIGTFGSFTQARLAIYASQMGLSVTGNNIANINTTGYTRQKLDQESFRTGGADRYHSVYSIRVGNGVLTTGVSQLRDPYLDIRYRSENSSVGAMDAKLGGLESIQAVLDEVGDGDEAFGIIEAQLSDLYNALQQLNNQTGQSEYDIQVRSSAEALAKQLNSYASKLEEVYNNAVTAYRQDLEEVNGILTSIRDLNAAIRKNEIHGDSALEMKDERNLLIDKLSEYMKIDVTYEKENIGAGIQVDKLIIKLGNANPDSKITTDSSTLIDGIYATQFEVPEFLPVKNDQYDETYTIDPADPDNLKGFKYLKKDPVTGATSGTNDPFEAMWDNTAVKDNSNSNFTLTLSKLTSAKGLVKEGSEKTLLHDNDLYGALQSERELLTERGEFASQDTLKDVDPQAATKRGIPYYQCALDLLANKLANSFNNANQGYIYNENGEYLNLTDNGDGTYTVNGIIDVTYNDGANTKTVPLTKDMTWDTLDPEVKAAMQADAPAGVTYTSIEEYVQNKGGIKLGTPLFSNGDGDKTEQISAKNISISASWSSGPQIVRSFKLPTGQDHIPSTDGDNIVSNIITLFTDKKDYLPTELDDDAQDKVMFTGTFQEMWVNIGSVLGNDMKTTNTLLNTYQSYSVNLDTSRMGVSSVDLNDEAMNLMQYSQSYNAACRLMTTIDSVLDKLINGTGTTL